MRGIYSNGCAKANKKLIAATNLSTEHSPAPLDSPYMNAHPHLQTMRVRRNERRKGNSERNLSLSHW